MYKSEEVLFGQELFAENCNEGDLPEHLNFDDVEESADTINGRVVGVSSNCEYKRGMILKLYDRLIYKQRPSDTLNTIILRSKEEAGDVTDRHVYIYGQLPGGISELTIGSSVLVRGKYDRNNHFYARELFCDAVRIKPKTEFNPILLGIVPMLILVSALVGEIDGIDNLVYQEIKENLVKGISFIIILFVGVINGIKQKKRKITLLIERWKSSLYMIILLFFLFLIFIL